MHPLNIHPLIDSTPAVHVPRVRTDYFGRHEVRASNARFSTPYADIERSTRRKRSFGGHPPDVVRRTRPPTKPIVQETAGEEPGAEVLNAKRKGATQVWLCSAASGSPTLFLLRYWPLFHPPPRRIAGTRRRDHKGPSAPYFQQTP
jgi:hypothetical protein